MVCKKPNVIFDPYTIIPTYGESRIALSLESNKLDLKIYYEDIEHKTEKSITISFSFVCFHKLSSFPGISGSKIEYEKYDSLTSLVEFKQSEFKEKWEKNFNNLFNLRHFVIFFTASNHCFEVICENFSIT